MLFYAILVQSVSLLTFFPAFLVLKGHMDLSITVSKFQGKLLKNMRYNKDMPSAGHRWNCHHLVMKFTIFYIQQCHTVIEPSKKSHIPYYSQFPLTPLYFPTLMRTQGNTCYMHVSCLLNALIKFGLKEISNRHTIWFSWYVFLRVCIYDKFYRYTMIQLQLLLNKSQLHKLKSMINIMNGKYTLHTNNIKTMQQNVKTAV